MHWGACQLVFGRHLQWAVDTYCPEVEPVGLLTGHEVLQDFAVLRGVVASCARCYRQDALAGSLVAKSHILLQISSHGRHHRGAGLGGGVVDELVGEHGAESVGVRGHGVETAEVAMQELGRVRALRVVAVEGVACC